MSFETERPETEGERVVRLFEEVFRSGAKAQKARERFKAETATPQAILGKYELPLDVTFRARMLGNVVIEKALTEIEAREIRARNLQELRGLLTPAEAERPIITVHSFDQDAITRAYDSPKRAPGEIISQVTGTVGHIGEFGFSLLTDEEAYNVFPAEFLSGNSKIAVTFTHPTYNEAAAA